MITDAEARGTDSHDSHRRPNPALSLFSAVDKVCHAEQKAGLCLHLGMPMRVILHAFRILHPLLHNLPRFFSALFPQRNEDPKPRGHLAKTPCEDYAVVEIGVARTHHVVD